MARKMSYLHEEEGGGRSEDWRTGGRSREDWRREDWRRGSNPQKLNLNLIQLDIPQLKAHNMLPNSVGSSVSVTSSIWGSLI